MKTTYVKSLKEYEGSSQFDAESLFSALKRVRGRRKPTSVALEDTSIQDLKKIAKKLDVPYQALMRLFIINNTIGGNVLAGVGQMSLSPNTVISGNLTYFAEEKASVQPGAVVAGKVEYHKQNVSQKKIENAPQQARQVMAAAGLGLKIYTAATLFLLGLVFIKFFPRFSARSIEIVQNQPMKAMGMGALMFFGLPVVAFLLFVSIIGIPFALFAIFLFSIYLYISKFFVALFIGKKLIDWFKWGNSLVLALFLGLVAWIVVTSLPVLGGLIQFIVILVGSGTLVMLKTEYLTTLKSKNLL
jgi:hypothetical protein